MDDREQFEEMNHRAIVNMSQDVASGVATRDWFLHASNHGYSYHFSWLGLPIIQYPQDIIAMQEIIWEVKPDLIIETGIARGGSLVFYASMLELLGRGMVLGVDVDIRAHNRKAIENHPMAKRITMYEGSSVEESMAARVRKYAKDYNTVLVALDSNHTHAHVLRELDLYAPMVTKGSYCVVFDTVIEDMPARLFPDRPWGPGNNPKTAVLEYLKTTDRFVVDRDIPNKLLITVAPDGYLKCVK